MKRWRAARPGSMEPGRPAMRPAETGPPEHGGYSFVTVVPDPLTALDRAVERAVAHTAALTALLADNECPHGGLSTDTHAQPGCEPGCAGYPRALREQAPPLTPGMNGRAIANRMGPEGLMQTILCACGRTWTRRAVRGRVPKCPTCREAAHPSPKETH